MTDSASSVNRQAAVDFLQLVVAGKIDEAYDKYVDMAGKHHNPYFPAGFASLKSAMAEDHSQFPNKRLTVVHVLSEGDLVAVHSHLKIGQDKQDMAVVHLFRFENSKIAEMWDCAGQLPPESPNTDGAF